MPLTHLRARQSLVVSDLKLVRIGDDKRFGKGHLSVLTVLRPLLRATEHGLRLADRLQKELDVTREKIAAVHVVETILDPSNAAFVSVFGTFA